MQALADPPANPAVRQLRARLAAHVRHGNRQAAAESRRELGVVQLADQIKRVTSGELPLTGQQRGRLILLLCPAPGADDAA